MSGTKHLDVQQKRVQSILYIINTIFLLIGLMLTALGSEVHSVYSEFEVFIHYKFFSPVIFIIIIGVVLIVQAIIGYIGILKNNVWLHFVYIIILPILLILEVSPALLGFVMRSEIYNTIYSNMQITMNNYNELHCAKQSWDVAQQRWSCCGVYSPQDWAPKAVAGVNITFGGDIFTVPESCMDAICNIIYKQGCLSVLGKYVSDSIVVIGLFAGILFIIQIGGIIFSCIHAKLSQKQREVKVQQHRFIIFDQLAWGQNEKVVTPVSSSTDA